MRALLTVICLLFLFAINTYAIKNSGDNSIKSPLNPPYYFAGNFGELRPNHFHAGLDFRTQGKIGLPVYAVKDGYISKIGVSPTGYGNVLYMNHSDGTTTLYGHLLKFQTSIQDYVREKQYDKESFALTLNPSENQFRFKQGDIIAWSGNTGSSGGPHLHFEIRNSKSEIAENPLFYPMGITDKSAPKVIALYVYPLDKNSNIGKERTKKRLEAISVPGGYRLKNNAPLEVFGKIGFGVQAEDYFNGVGLKCGIYSAHLYCDKKEVFGFKMDQVAFEDTKYANSQGDLEEYMSASRRVERLYKQPGNKLDIYTLPNSSGVLNFDDGKSHDFELIVSDAFKNKATLHFKTKEKKSIAPVRPKPNLKEFAYDKSNSFENDKIKIEIPKGALYDNLYFNYSATPKIAGCYSELHKVGSKTILTHIPYTLSISCEELPSDLKNKALIVAVDPAKGRKSAIGGEYSHGWVTAKANAMGTFSIAIDQTPPVITPVIAKGKKSINIPKLLQFHISDNLSGIKSYKGEIDGHWALFEYDEKIGLLTYTIDKTKVAAGKSHLLHLEVKDNKNNSSEYKTTFNL